MAQLHQLSTWRTSSYSHDTDCVECGSDPGASTFGVRDTKDREAATLLFDRAEWSAFVNGVRRGRFDLP